MRAKLQRVTSLACLIAFMLIVAAPAQSTVLKGDLFVEVMNGNTLSGFTLKGVPFNLYFLPGGSATYDEKGGISDIGRWRMSKAGRVCVTWRKWQPGREHCYMVRLKGRTITWTGTGGSGSGLLRGYIASSYLRMRRQS
jgi:hypothetical protein